MREAGGDVIGLDWRVRLDEGWQRVGHDVAVMGNLDPVALFAKQDTLRAQAKTNSGSGWRTTAATFSIWTRHPAGDTG